jgi:hypothetical protein
VGKVLPLTVAKIPEYIRIGEGSSKANQQTDFLSRMRQGPDVPKPEQMLSQNPRNTKAIVELEIMSPEKRDLVDKRNYPTLNHPQRILDNAKRNASLENFGSGCTKVLNRGALDVMFKDSVTGMLEEEKVLNSKLQKRMKDMGRQVLNRQAVSPMPNPGIESEIINGRPLLAVPSRLATTKEQVTHSGKVSPFPGRLGASRVHLTSLERNSQRVVRFF